MISSLAWNHLQEPREQNSSEDRAQGSITTSIKSAAIDFCMASSACWSAKDALQTQKFNFSENCVIRGSAAVCANPNVLAELIFPFTFWNCV
jgi:hypothetical protein